MGERTNKKLLEAKFFLGKLTEADKQLGSDEFGFYLSAFLNATRCVCNMLHYEYGRVDADWKSWLNEHEPDLKELRTERVAEVHSEGAHYSVKVEMVPVTQLRRDAQGHPAYEIFWCAPPDIPAPEVELQSHYIGNTTEEVTAWAKRQLDQHKRFVREFEEWRRGGD